MVLSLVSICIPTYNRAGMVRKAIESALSQTYTNIEILVVDDASNDDIESVIAGYNNEKLHFFKNKRNLGQFGNFNRCIELSKGKYIHILHSDDYIDSNFISISVDFMESHPNVMMTCGTAIFINSNKQSKVAVSDHDIIYPAQEGFRKILEDGNFIVCPSVVIKREVYDSVGLFSCEYPYAGDLYQWLRILQKFDFAYVADAIVFYRQGNHSESFQLLQKTPLGYIDYIKIYLRIIEELCESVENYRTELNLSIRKRMYSCINNGIWLSKSTISFSPQIFIGFAFNLWTIIQPDSIYSRINKYFELIYILIVGFLLPFSLGRFFLIFSLRLKRKIFHLLRQYKSYI